MIEQQYLELRRKLTDLYEEMAHCKKQLIEQFLASQYPDISFHVFVDEYLKVAIDIVDIDASEIKAISEEIKKYLLNLDISAGKKGTVQQCITTTNPSP